MNANSCRVLKIPILVAGVCLRCFVFGCNNAPSRSTLQASAAQSTPVAQPANSDNPGISLQCVAERIQSAPPPFHWSFKKIVTPDTNADWEADVTADAIGGTLIDSSGTRAIHGVRSDKTSWNTAVLILTGPLPASTFALVDNSSAAVRVGADTVNGVDSTKYAIDTSRDTATEASLIRNVLGPQGFVKGTAWVTTKGCPIKFVLDVEQHNQDGTVLKEHYELNLSTQ